MARIALRVERGALVPADRYSAEALKARKLAPSTNQESLQMTDIRWATPKGFPAWVEVSTAGEVRLLGRRIVRRNGVDQTIHPKILTQKVDRGYALVQFRINGKHKGYRVHRLVMLAHGDGDGVGLDVNHKNGNRSDNRIDNLEWCTRSENHIHAYRQLGRVSAMKGRESPNKGKRNEAPHCRPVVGVPVGGGDQVWFPSAAEAGRCGFSQSGIAHCLRGRQKTCMGYAWSDAEDLAV